MSGAKTMTPSELQAPPRGLGASETVWSGPPEASMFLNFPSAKKPIDRESDDQKGNFPPLFDGSDDVSPVSRDWIQRRPPAPKTTRLPSGETVTGAPSSPVRR